ncbi:peptidase inhibitor family I36 protein [Streptomyces sp. NPDC050287]|uniref:peptidase inhibitor family I36 protein n=1 Tax=Streptomyces sp. NPDC050287 TaxID=3365608 RepID=UPI0037B6857C
MTMSAARRRVTLAATAAALAGGLTVAAPAHAHPAGPAHVSAVADLSAASRPCPSNRWCLYQNTNYGGAYYFAKRSSDSNLSNNKMSDGRSITRRTSSAWNNLPNKFVRLYYERNWGGPHVCIRPGTGIKNLRPYGLDNHVYSIGVSTAACGS